MAQFAIRDAQVFDGEGAVGRPCVVVEDGVIHSVSRGAPPAEVDQIDGTDCTLLPGFIDAHVHAWGPLRRTLGRYVQFGVTTVLEMECDGDGLEEVRQIRTEDPPQCAQIFSSGFPVTVPGGHGTEYGFDVPTVSDAESMQDFVDARLAEGSDFIKIIRNDARHSSRTLSGEMLTAAIEAAHAREALTAIHISTQRTAMEAVIAGADLLAHVFLDAVDPSFAGVARERNIGVIPTLSVLLAASREGGSPDYTHCSPSALAKDPRLAAHLTSFDRRLLGLDMARWRAEQGLPVRTMPEGWRFQHALEAVQALHNAGVPILAGTDAPNPGTTHGVSMHHELQLLVLAGLGPRDALRAATSVAADAFHLAGRGRIAHGMRADLLLVRGDPLVDITATRDIVKVWRGGISVRA